MSTTNEQSSGENQNVSVFKLTPEESEHIERIDTPVIFSDTLRIDEEPISDIESSSTQDKARKPLKLIIGGTALALAITGGALFLTSKDGEEKIPDYVKEAATETTQTTQNEPSSSELQEVLMSPTGDDPAAIANALIKNRDCYMNKGWDECLEHYIFETSESDLMTSLRTTRARIEGRQKELGSMSYTEKYTSQLLDYNFSDPEVRYIRLSVNAQQGQAAAWNYTSILTLWPKINDDGVKEWLVAYEENGPVERVS